MSWVHAILLLGTLIFLYVEVIEDAKDWPNINHTKGAIRRAIGLGVVSITVVHPWPFLIFGLMFNPWLSKKKGLDFFYLGDTAWYDKTMKKVFGKLAGYVSFFGALVILILSLIFINYKRQLADIL